MGQATAFLNSLWNFMLVSSPFLLLGLLASGLLHRFLSVEKIRHWLGGDGVGPIFRAAILGVPLPLCSCAVIPAAVTLRKSGASNAATSSFLISTPESGLDSLGVTYALMGWPMAVLRPLAAFISAFTAGILQLFFNPTPGENLRVPLKMVPPKDDCCAHRPTVAVIQHQDHNHNHGHEHPHAGQRSGPIGATQDVLRYALVDLVDDMAGWFILGIFVAAGIDAFIPSDFFLSMNGPLGKLAIVALSIPMYICASAATPMAASMMMKGLGPGAALLFMLCGPATNISNILVLQKYIGKRGVVLNIVAIIICAWGLAIFADHFFPLWGWDKILMQTQEQHGHEKHGMGSGPLALVSAIIMSILLLKGAWAQFKEKFMGVKA